MTRGSRAWPSTAPSGRSTTSTATSHHSSIVRETPERIGLLFFVHLGEQGNASCGAQEQIVTGPGYREFIVGNPEMLVSYEVGTEAVLQELGSNISALSEYMERSRPCPTTLFEPFESSLVCSWGYSGTPSSTR